MDPWFSASLTTPPPWQLTKFSLMDLCDRSMATLIIRDSGLALTNRCLCQLRVSFFGQIHLTVSCAAFAGDGGGLGLREESLGEEFKPKANGKWHRQSQGVHIKQGTARKIHGITVIYIPLSQNWHQTLLISFNLAAWYWKTFKQQWRVFDQGQYICVTNEKFYFFTSEISVFSLTALAQKKRQVWLNITDRYYIWRHFLRSPKDSHFPSTFLSIGSRCLTDREPAWTTSVENCLHQLWLLCRRSNKGDIHTRQEKEQMKLSHFFFWFSLLYGWISAISPFSDFHRHLSFHTPSVPVFSILTSSWYSVNRQHLQSCNIMLFCRLMPK